MATNARAVANEFIRLAAEDGRTLTPLQIIKLVYIAHGWMHRRLVKLGGGIDAPVVC
jgi:uncharacterized phage-associated protein